jgi:hypothetical protein
MCGQGNIALEDLCRIGEIMDKSTFTQKVDKRSRQAMESYLENHHTYCDHYRIGYAHKVKLHNLKLPDYDKAEMLTEDEFTYVILGEIIQEFNDNHPLSKARIEWAGRSGGYLVLHVGMSEWSIFDSRYDAGMDFDDLKWYTEIVQEFDQCVQEVYECFYQMCMNEEEL